MARTVSVGLTILFHFHSLPICASPASLAAVDQGRFSLPACAELGPWARRLERAVDLRTVVHWRYLLGYDPRRSGATWVIRSVEGTGRRTIAGTRPGGQYALRTGR